MIGRWVASFFIFILLPFPYCFTLYTVLWDDLIEWRNILFWISQYDNTSLWLLWAPFSHHPFLFLVFCWRWSGSFLFIPIKQTALISSWEKICKSKDNSKRRHKVHHNWYSDMENEPDQLKYILFYCVFLGIFLAYYFYLLFVGSDDGILLCRWPTRITTQSNLSWVD